MQFWLTKSCLAQNRSEENSGLRAEFSAIPKIQYRDVSWFPGNSPNTTIRSFLRREIATPNVKTDAARCDAFVAVPTRVNLTAIP